ncbi:MAG TPA: DUF4031 domain-containing protein [bacterium]|nr:DUF4031 domain-containing protein [bacterium]
MVYVDNMKAPYRRMLMCHMAADTVEELHEMADHIGIQRKWFQNKPRFPHYDICQTKKALAIGAGAIAITQKELVTFFRRNI